MEIKREKYLDDLVVRMGNGMIKIVTGVRRCGKTYLLFKLFRDYLRERGVDDDHVVAAQLDAREFEALRDPDALYDYLSGKIGSDHGQYYVLLDEIQYAIAKDEFKDSKNPPRLYGVLNGLLHRYNVDVYVTGSNSKLLSTDVMTEFRGRGDEVRVRPLSFSEFMQGFDGDRRDGWDEYVVYGGMPLTLSLRTHEQKADYLRRLFDEVYFKDIVSRYDVRKPDELGTLVDVLASNIGSLTSSSKIEATFKSELRSDITDATLSSYIGHLAEAFIVEGANRYSVKGRKYIGSPKKYYFEDVGLRNARIGFRQIEENHLMENVVYNELVGRGIGVDVGVVPVSTKDEDGKSQRVQLEIDFVCNRGSKRYYVQSAFALPTPEKRDQEQRPLLKADDGFKKVIVTKEGFEPHYNESGILMMNVYDFLLNQDSLDF